MNELEPDDAAEPKQKWLTTMQAADEVLDVARRLSFENGLSLTAVMILASAAVAVEARPVERPLFSLLCFKD